MVEGVSIKTGEWVEIGTFLVSKIYLRCWSLSFVNKHFVHRRLVVRDLLRN